MEGVEVNQLRDLRRQLFHRAAVEEELGEGIQLPHFFWEHIHVQLHPEYFVGAIKHPGVLVGDGAIFCTPEEEQLLDAVTVPRDTYPRAWALALGPPLFQRRARRPHRPQRVLVRILHRIPLWSLTSACSAWSCCTRCCRDSLVWRGDIDLRASVLRNTLTTQRRAGQTHSQSRSLRVYPRHADPTLLVE
eukprot:scaffold3608_cov65-Phaeocystis_antarctica.AAC.5